MSPEERLERDVVALRHMLDAARKAIRFTRDRSRPDLDNDELPALGVVRLLEILGEAARRVSAEARGREAAVPWRQITGTRDRLIHGYEEVDLDIVWTIVTRELPPLVGVLERMLQDMEV